VAQGVADRPVVRQALGQLPASQREAVILRHVAGLSEAAAAQDEELDAILAALCGDLDDAELDHRTARFRGALRRLREDPAEATRIDELLTDASGDTTVVTLVTRAVAGNPDAWNAIVERYSALVWSICTRFKISGADTEDAAQKVWLLLIEHLSDLREPAALPGWLPSRTGNACGWWRPPASPNGWGPSWTRNGRSPTTPRSRTRSSSRSGTRPCERPSPSCRPDGSGCCRC
jgi:Sigma-70 region 2